MAGPHGWADGMRCIACGSKAVTERPERTAQGYRRFRCRACGKQFNERTGGHLNRTQYPSDGIGRCCTEAREPGSIPRPAHQAVRREIGLAVRIMRLSASTAMATSPC
jgi:transposase-like protein